MAASDHGIPPSLSFRNQNSGGISMRSIGIRAAFAMLMVVSACVSALGQSTNASLSGVVQDAQGAVIPNAPVVATQIDTSQSRTVQSGADGHYIITNPPIDSSKISACPGGLRPILFPPSLCR